MAIIWANGFDDGRQRTSAQAAGGATVGIVTTPVRTGTRSMVVSGGAVISWFGVFHAALGAGFVHCAVRSGSIQTRPVVSFYDAVAPGYHLHLYRRQDGRFDLRAGGSGTVLAIGAASYPEFVWLHLAIKVVIANVGGSFELRINGSTTPDISFSGDTQNTVNASWTQTYFGDVAVGFSTYHFDDIIISDTTGSAPENDWLGDAQIDSVIADGDGDATDWAIGGSSPAATRWQSIDDIPADDGVTLIEDNTVAQKNLCTFAAIPTTQPVAAFIAAMLTARMAKQSATARGVKQTVKESGIETQGAEHTLTTSYVDYADVFHDDPGGAAWDNTKFNAAQFGVEVTT